MSTRIFNILEFFSITAIIVTNYYYLRGYRDEVVKIFKVPIDYIPGGEFIRWDMSKEHKLYPDINGTQIINSNMLAAESETVYNTSNSGETKSF